MPEFFVWSTLLFVEVIEAVTAQDAAEAFLELPTTALSDRNRRPDCYVQRTNDLEAPRADGETFPFWVVFDDDAPFLGSTPGQRSDRDAS